MNYIHTKDIRKQVAVDPELGKNCFHCGQIIPLFCDLNVSYKTKTQPVCCHGCKAAFEFIHDQGMADFYRYRGDKLPELMAVDESRLSQRWQAFDNPQVFERYVEVKKGQCHTSIYIQGMYCSSCAWLIEKSLSQLSDGLRIQLNVDTHHVQLAWPQKSARDVDNTLSDVLRTISQLGYHPRPLALDGLAMDSAHLRQSENKQSLKRLAVAGLGMMQVMTYAIGLYLGDYQGIDADIKQFLTLVSMLVATVVVFYSGQPFFKHAWFDVKNKHLGMDVPVALAVGSAYFFSVYDVFFRGADIVYFDSAVMFVFLLSLGRFVEMRARYCAASSTQALLQLLPPVVAVQRKAEEHLVERLLQPKEIKVGDCLQVLTGETIACDGMIYKGNATVDESILNGEPTPVHKGEGDCVIAGSVVRQGEISIQATSVWSDGSVAVIDRLLGNARPTFSSDAELRHGEHDAQQVPLMDKIARHFVLTILVLTACVASFWWFYAPECLFEIVLAMLVASCPCAFSLATPVVMTVAAQRLRQQGVLITNFSALAKLKKISHWCFDKTGTLTHGQMRIVDVQLLAQMDEVQTLQVMASLEQGSKHLLASAFAQIAKPYHVSNLSETQGCGLKADLALDPNGEKESKRDTYYLGKPEWVMQQAGITQSMLFDSAYKGSSHILLAIKAKPLAYVLIDDQIRVDAKATLNFLVNKTEELTVLSGDRQAAVDHVTDSLGQCLRETNSNEGSSEHVSMTGYGDILPEQKQDFILKQQSRGVMVAMVGDGVNDAPVLQCADVSVAMASGSELSQSYADFILLGGRLSSIKALYQMAERSQTIIRQNMVWAIAYNALVLPLAATGHLTPWVAALGMSLSSLLVVLNAQRLRRLKRTS